MPVCLVRLPYTFRLGINVYSGIVIDCIRYGFIPSVVNFSNVLELAIAYYNFLAALYDQQSQGNGAVCEPYIYKCALVGHWYYRYCYEHLLVNCGLR